MFFLNLALSTGSQRDLYDISEVGYFLLGHPVCYICMYRYLPNIHFVFASVPNSGPNSVFVFGQIVSSERIRMVSLYIV